MDNSRKNGQGDDHAERQSPEETEKSPVDKSPETDRGMTQLVAVVQAHSVREAQTMKSILESAEIPAFLGSEKSSEGGTLRGIPILVPEEMSGQAAEVLADAAMDDEEDGLEDEIDDELDDPWRERGEHESYFGDPIAELDEEDDDHYDDLDPFEDDDDF